MMSPDPTGILPQDSSMAAPLRTFAYVLLLTVLLATGYLWVRAALLLYDLYAVLMWLGTLA